MLDCELLREVYINLRDAKEPKFNLSPVLEQNLSIDKSYNKQIVNKNPNIWILGKDYLDRPVEGKQAKDYLDDYSKLSKTV